MKFLLLPPRLQLRFAQSAPLAPSPADLLYRSGKFAKAADAYSALLKLSDNNRRACRTRPQPPPPAEIDKAYETPAAALRAQPNSALLHAAMGEIQSRRAQ